MGKGDECMPAKNTLSSTFSTFGVLLTQNTIMEWDAFILLLTWAVPPPEPLCLSVVCCPLQISGRGGPRPLCHSKELKRLGKQKSELCYYHFSLSHLASLQPWKISSWTIDLNAGFNISKYTTKGMASVINPGLILFLNPQLSSSKDGLLTDFFLSRFFFF